MAIKRRKASLNNDTNDAATQNISEKQADEFANRLQDKQYGVPIRPQKEDSEVLSLRITRTQWEQITDLSVERRKAKEKNHSKTEIIREAIHYYIKYLKRI